MTDSPKTAFLEAGTEPPQSPLHAGSLLVTGVIGAGVSIGAVFLGRTAFAEQTDKLERVFDKLFEGRTQDPEKIADYSRKMMNASLIYTGGFVNMIGQMIVLRSNTKDKDQQPLWKDAVRIGGGWAVGAVGASAAVAGGEAFMPTRLRSFENGIDSVIQSVSHGKTGTVMVEPDTKLSELITHNLLMTGGAAIAAHPFHQIVHKLQNQDQQSVLDAR